MSTVSLTLPLDKGPTSPPVPQEEYEQARQDDEKAVPTLGDELVEDSKNTTHEASYVTTTDKEVDSAERGPRTTKTPIMEPLTTTYASRTIPDIDSPSSLPNDGESFDTSLNSPERSTTTAAAGEGDDHSKEGIKVLFLSSDTGGGHRASAESLAKQFQLLYPGSTYDLVDVVGEDFGPPLNSLVGWYKHLSSHPSQWKLLYTISNSRGFEMFADTHFKLVAERAIRKRIKKHNPDVVVSVHPLMTNVPLSSCKRISDETGRHLPMFTVVTDLGSAHCLWFANGVEKMFVGSERVKDLAKARGKVPEEKLVLSGLPIRHDFAVQAEKLGDRMSPEGKKYQVQIRTELQLPCTHRKTLLVMGGGEGVGSLSRIVDALYVELVSQGIDALVLVVCGRNEKLKKSLENRDWASVFEGWQATKNREGGSKSLISFGEHCGTRMTADGCIQGAAVTGSIRRMLGSGSMKVGNVMATPEPLHSPGGSPYHLAEEKKADDTARTTVEPLPDDVVKENRDDQEGEQRSGMIQTDDIGVIENENTKAAGDVQVFGLGFVTRMAEYMVAADILISKAGPGTISEAAALSLPVMLTSFLPGQEEGNIDFVIDGGFGTYVSDSDPVGIAEEICMWLTDEERRAKLSAAAKLNGAPWAARDIVQQIGDSTIKWREINREKDWAEASVEQEQKEQQLVSPAK